ncbi:MAG: protein kinase [Candidatus Margulisiibacteriota bacterium]
MIRYKQVSFDYAEPLVVFPSTPVAGERTNRKIAKSPQQTHAILIGERGQYQILTTVSSEKIRQLNLPLHQSPQPQRALLGSGDFGKVKYGVNDDNKTVAIKCIKGDAALEASRHEADILRQIRGIPGVCELLDVITAETHTHGTSPAPTTELCTYLVQPVYPISSDDFKAYCLPEAEEPRIQLMANTAIHLITAVEMLHARSVYHQDIKPDNIRFMKHEHPQLAYLPVLIDFGLATNHNGLVTSLEAQKGTPEFRPPESTDTTGYTPAQHDAWALTATLYTLFGGPNAIDYFAYWTEHPDFWDLPVSITHILAQMCSKNPDHRLPLADAKAQFQSLLA